MRILKTILLAFLPFMLTAQQSLVEEVRSLFDESVELEWVNSFSGYINDIIKVEATLGFDGRNCKGIFYYPSSGFSTEVTGTATGNRFLMNEVNEEGLITGKITGEIDQQNIKARWSNYNNSIGCRYRLTNDSETKVNIDESKWVRWYIGQVSNEILHLILHKKSETEITGSCYNETGSRSYQVTGQLNKDKTLALQFLLGENEMASFTGKMPKGKAIKGSVTGIGLLNESMVFYLDNKLNYEEKGFQSFNTTYEIMLPINGNKDFDDYVKKSSEDWVNECITKSHEKTYKESEIPKPEERLINRAYIYPDIRYVADNLVSGHLIFVNTWTNKTKTKPLNFDLKNDIELSLDQIFTKDLAFRDSLTTYMKSIGRPGFNYVYFNITPEGLRLYDDFEPFQGRNDFIVPYAVIKPWARKTGPLKKLL